MTTNKNRCLLAGECKQAGNPAECKNTCSYFIGLHGMSGHGGRAAAANVPADYRLLTVASSPARANQPAVYKAVDAYVKTFERQFEENGERIKSLYLYSVEPGNGKTSTAVALLNEFIIANYLGSLKRNRQADQRPVFLLDVTEWQKLYNAFTRQGTPTDVSEPKAREYYRWMDLAQKTQFVVCDDIGVRSATEAFRADLHSVINYRTTNALPTVFTSNLPIEEMANVFDARLYDRMRDMCAVLPFTGESKRGRR